MVTLLEGGNKTPTLNRRAHCSAGSQLDAPPQLHSSLHNQIKTSPSQTIFKQSEHRCDSRQESTWLCLHEKTPQRCCLQTGSSDLQEGWSMEASRIPLQLACGHHPCSWPGCSCWHCPSEESLKAGSTAHSWVQQSLAAWERVNPCADFINEKSELYFLAQRSTCKEEGSMTGQTFLCSFCIGVYWSARMPSCLKEPSWTQSQRKWVHTLSLGSLCSGPFLPHGTTCPEKALDKLSWPLSFLGSTIWIVLLLQLSPSYFCHKSKLPDTLFLTFKTNRTPFFL